MNGCIFCKIVRGELPNHTIWEDERHLAFLSIFPNTEGFSVVITKEHYPSYIAETPAEVSAALFGATLKVAQLLDKALSDVGRTGIMFEGFGVNHIHAKLFPMHGTKNDEWKQHKSHVKKYFAFYEGYMSSHDAERADDRTLTALAEKIRKEI